MHMPAPRERTGEAYFAPLRDLRLQSETEFYLGLVHMPDGVDGTLTQSISPSRFPYSNALRTPAMTLSLSGRQYCSMMGL